MTKTRIETQAVDLTGLAYSQ